MRLEVFTSTTVDGSMKSLNGDQSTARNNRVNFLEKNHIEPSSTTLHTLGYGGDDYCRYTTLNEFTKGDGILRDSTVDADAVVVTKPEHAILLPLGDCVGAVINDPVRNILMVSHLGRHNLVQLGGTKCIEFLIEKHGCNPKDLTVWLSPAAGKDQYPLYAFDNRSLHDVSIEQLIASGIPTGNISASPIDSAASPKYFSHSQFLKGNQETDGRFAVVALLA